MDSTTPPPKDADGPEDFDFDDDGFARPRPVLRNLYQILHTTVFNHKKTEGKDIGMLNKLVTDETRSMFRSVDIGKNMEKSCFSIVLTDMNDLSRLIAHASFTDIPTDPNIVVNGKRWKRKKELSKSTSTNTLFMSVFVFRDDEAMETCIAEIIANTFSACESVEFIILECPDVDYVGGGYVFSTQVSEITFKAKSAVMKKLIVYSKDSLLPKLKIRQGRELDLDDLIPLINIDPMDLEETFHKHFLVDLISMNEGRQISFVAEFEGYAVGMIAISADVNYSLLNEQFHLEPFHGLFKPYPEDEINCKPVQSCLLDPPRPSEIHLKETFHPNAKDEALRREHRSTIDASHFAKSSVFSESGDGHVRINSVVGGGDGGVDLSAVDSFMDRMDSQTSRQIQVDNREQVSAEVGGQRFIRAPYRRESNPDKDIGEDEGEDREDLLATVREIIDKLEQEGQTLGTARLDANAIRTLTEAQAFINNCVNRYLHRTLIDDKLLPMTNWNEPPPSTFLGFPNAVALQLVVLDKKYHARINNLINGVFAAFPTREYCIVTTPAGAPELPWMKYFVRVTPRSTSLHPTTLYVMHRACFSNTIRIRRAKEEDVDKVASLLETLVEGEKILCDFRTTFCQEHNVIGLESFVAEVTTHASVPVIALGIIGPEERAGGYQVNYELDEYTYFDLHDPVTDHAYVHHFIMNPIFQPHSKIVMKEIMRLSNKDCFYHRIFPVAVDCKLLQHQSLLNNLEDFTPLIPRRRIEYSLLSMNEIYDDLRQPPKSSKPSTVPFVAFHYSKKFTYEPKTVVSKRVVFVGASETILSSMEKIMSSPYCDFKNLTLISTHGLPGSLPRDEIRNLFFPKKNGIALSMKTNEEWHQRLPIRSSVTTVYATAIRILRKIKVVVVDDNKIVPYDILVIGTGRQFIRPDFPVADVVDERLDIFKRSLLKDAAEKPVRPPTPPKPKNVFLINTETDAAQALNLLRSFIPFVSNRQVIVHGACLEAYCCLRALIQLGISPHRITFITTVADEMEWEACHGYRDTSQLRDLMTKTIFQLGIEILAHYDFRRWTMDMQTELVSRVYFSTTMTVGTERPTKVSVPCLAYFAFCTRRVGDEIVSAIASSYLPYNNGIIINTRFETVDPSIMAAGPCTVYDKRLSAEKFDHFQFTSYEIGQTLGELILERIVPPTKSINIRRIGPNTPPFPPTMAAPLVHYAELPGSWHYMHVSRPGWIPHCCRQAECRCKDCDCGTEIITGSIDRREDPEQKLFRLRLDKYQRVDALECISRQKFPPACLSALYGHHAAFLNKLLERVETEEVTDLYQHFCQPWAAALGMDRWLSFRQEIQHLVTHYDITKGVKIPDFVRDYVNNLENPEVFKVDSNILRHVFENTNLKAAIESKFLNFLKYNKAVLPMYARPDFVEETYNERLLSPMYVPLHKNFGL